MNSVFTHIFLLASVQGFLLAILLFARKQNHAANTVLCVLVGALSVDLLQVTYYVNSLYYEYPHLMGITFVFPFLYGPLFYLYVLQLTTGKRRLEQRDFLHFLPALVILVYVSWVYFLTGAEKIEFIHRLNTDRPLDFGIIDNLKPLHGLLYTILTIRLIARHNRRIRDVFSNIDRINLLWLRSLTIGVAIIWSIVVIGAVASDVPHLQPSGSNFAVYFCISLLIYAIGYMGLNQPEVFRQAIGDAKLEPVEAAPQEPRYAKSGLRGSSADEILTRLRELMERDKPHLNGDLTLARLAESIFVSPHNLSEAMNTRLKQSFYDFVNSYRVNEVKQRLQVGDAARYNILSIAYDSGFTSKTSFNTIFKKHSGMTPSQFIESLAAARLGSTANAEPPKETK